LALAIALRGVARFSLGIAGAKDDLRQALAMTRAIDAMTLAAVRWFSYVVAIPYGMLLPDASALPDTAETLAVARQSGDGYTLDSARTIRGIALVHHEGPEREAGFDLLAKARERIRNKKLSLLSLQLSTSSSQGRRRG
jgi:adenylate cyclase